MSKPILTQSRLRELLDYNPETGVFTSRAQRRGGHRPGSIVGNLAGAGYLIARIDGERHYLHRLVWLYMYGLLPTSEVDHINGLKTDNRMSNLRLVTHAENQHNHTRSRTNNWSGYPGVTWHEASTKWRARITVNSVEKYLGTFVTRQEASDAYLAAKLIHHPSAPVAQQGA